MKNSYLLLLILFYPFNQIAFAQQWEKAGREGNKTVLAKDEYIFSRNDNGLLIRSEDAGESWATILNIRNGNLRITKDNKIYFFNEDTLLKSSNHGTIWDTIKMPDQDIEAEEDFPYYFDYDVEDMVLVDDSIIILQSLSTNYDNPAYSEVHKLISDEGKLIRYISFTDHPCDAYNNFQPSIFTDGKSMVSIFIDNSDCSDQKPIALAISKNNGYGWRSYPLDSILPHGYKFRDFLDDGRDIYLRAHATGDSKNLKLFKMNFDGPILNELYPAGLPSLAFSILCRMNNILFAVYDSYLFYSHDEGGNWFSYSLSELPENIKINSLVRAQNYLFLGTDQGIWRSEFNEIVLSNTSSAMASLKLYPNPSSGSVALSGLDSFTSLEIFDFKGEKIFQTEGNKEMQFQIENPGLYLVHLRNDQGYTVKKVLIR